MRTEWITLRNDLCEPENSTHCAEVIGQVLYWRPDDRTTWNMCIAGPTGWGWIDNDNSPHAIPLRMEIERRIHSGLPLDDISVSITANTMPTEIIEWSIKAPMNPKRVYDPAEYANVEEFGVF